MPDQTHDAVNKILGFEPTELNEKQRAFSDELRGLIEKHNANLGLMEILATLGIQAGALLGANVDDESTRAMLGLLVIQNMSAGVKKGREMFETKGSA